MAKASLYGVKVTARVALGNFEVSAKPKPQSVYKNKNQLAFIRAAIEEKLYREVWNNPFDPDSQIIIDDHAPHKSMTVAEYNWVYQKKPARAQGAQK